MMVVFIMGILALAVVVTLDGLTPSTRFRAAARDIGGLIRIARGTAIAQKRELHVVYNVPDGKYMIRVPPPPQTVDDIFSVKKKEPENVVIRRLPDGVFFVDVDKGDSSPSKSNEIIIEVSPYGSVTPHAVHIKGELSSSEVGEMTIEFNSLVGVVNYYDKYKTLDQPEKDAEE